MLRHRFAIVVSGIIWTFCGAVLFFRGVHYLAASSSALLNCAVPKGPLIACATSFLGSVEKGLIMLLCMSVSLGFIKGRFILKRSVERIVEHIYALPSPFPLKDIYPKPYYFLIVSMIALGCALKFIPLPIDIKGVMDSVVGAALINGAMLYFRSALISRQAKEQT